MRFQIPQFIETEDKIVGPLSLKQFAYLCGAIGFAALLFFIINFYVWLIIAVPIMTVGVAMAFIKVNGRSFPDIAAAAFKFYWNPQLYLWQADHPTIEKVAKPASPSLEKIVSGIALKSAWQEVQTGSKVGPAEAAKRSFAQLRERYEIVSKISGARTAGKRIDYR